MSHLTDEQLVVLRDLLDRHEREIRTGVTEHAARLREWTPPGVTTPAGDMADQAEAGQLRDHESVAMTRGMQELRAIEMARARIAEGAAGVCIDCAVDIPFTRLRVQPTASRCVRCQDLYERTHSGSPEALGRDG